MPKKRLKGKVTSVKNTNTVTVTVNSRVFHKLYKKIIIKSKKYKAHTLDDNIKLNEIVTIEDCAPISKTKKWKVVQ